MGILQRNVYWKCHNHWRLYRQKQSVGILPRVEKYLLHMPSSPTCIPTDISRRYFTESWKIFTAYATITDRIFPMGIFFCAHFSSVKPSVFIFTDTISNRMWNYRRTLCWRILSVGELVGKKFTNEVAILHQRIRSVNKTVKCCSEIVNILWKVVKITNY